MIFFVDTLFVIGMLIFLGVGAYGLVSWLADNLLILIVIFGIAIGILVLWFKALFRWPWATLGLTAITVPFLMMYLTSV